MKFLEIYKKSLNETPKEIIVYRGDTVDFNDFNTDYLGTGQGYDQEGPGFYFTTDEQDASRYGTVKKFKLKLNKVVKTEPGNYNKKEVEWLMRKAPKLNDALEDWGENPNSAFKEAFSNIIETSDTQNEAFQTVWFDIFKKDSKKFLESVVKLGYDGIIVKKQFGVTHYVVYNPKAIQKIQ